LAASARSEAARAAGRPAGAAARAALVAAACASPLLLHLAVVHRSRAALVAFLALAAAGMVAARLPWPLVALVAAGALFVPWIGFDVVAQLALAGPAAAFLGMAWLFGRTLSPGRVPLVERISRVERDGDFPPALAPYARRLTAVWALLLAAIPVADVAVALAAGPAAQSAIVNLASWTLIAGLFFGEYAYRRWRYPHFPHKPPLAVARNLVRRAPEWLRP
jgi:uncharacterized membrane protein